MENDTIAAVSTARGEGGVAIVRLSGPQALSILRDCFVTKDKRAFAPRRLCFGRVVDGDGAVIDEAMAVYLPAPKTYTREEMAEIQCHGGDEATRAVLARVLECGTRPAEPGEFTKRAFLNGRLGLDEAEAVMELIRATGASAARAAVRQLEGGVSRFVRAQREALLGAMAAIAAADDFPEEVEEGAARDETLQILEKVDEALREAADAREARVLREGISVVIAGSPNVGKSSLMNALLRAERAIVADIPGTTRDVLTERLRINGVCVELTDTAGQRDTADPLEKMGVERAGRAEQSADVVLYTIDASLPLAAEDAHRLRDADERYIFIRNKRDLPPRLTEEELKARTARPVLSVSAAAGEGLEELFAALAARVTAPAAGEGRMTVARHLDCARRSREALNRAMAAIRGELPLDVAAVDIGEALFCLDEITGGSASEDAVARVFRDFCVGK